MRVRPYESGLGMGFLDTWSPRITFLLGKTEEIALFCESPIGPTVSPATCSPRHPPFQVDSKRCSVLRGDHNNLAVREIPVAESTYLLPATNCTRSKGARTPICETASFARSTRIQANMTATRHANLAISFTRWPFGSCFDWPSRNSNRVQPSRQSATGLRNHWRNTTYWCRGSKEINRVACDR